MKTEEELNALKAEVAALDKKLRELSVEELEQVTGGTAKSGYYLPVSEFSGIADSD